MAGSEKALGSETEQDTTTMSVPGCKEGYTVFNTQWVGFGSKGWMEIGQLEGEEKCELWFYYAYELEGGYHHYWEAPWTWTVTKNSWNDYSVQHYSESTWCWYIGENWATRQNCVSGYPTSTKELLDGAEVADESEPTFAGSVVTNFTAGNGSIKTFKNPAEVEGTSRGVIVPEKIKNLCWSYYGSPHIAGNINYGTC